MAITKKRRKWTAIAAISLFVVVVLGGLMPLASKSSNCSGNSAAMAACGSIDTALSIVASERKANSIDLSTLTVSEREVFGQIAGLRWLGDAKVLVKLRLDFDSTNEVVLAVCNQAFRNVPQKLIGQAPPTHAALIQNRGVVLLPVDEFHHLDLPGFVDVRSLAETSDVKTQDGNLDE
jgi:hypothetical protein